MTEAVKNRDQVESKAFRYSNGYLSRRDCVTIARRSNFNAGSMTRGAQVPKGRLKRRFSSAFSAVPSGLDPFAIRLLALKHQAILTQSFRDKTFPLTPTLGHP